MAEEVVFLVIEDEPLIRMSIEDALEGGGYAVVSAPDGALAIELLETRNAELAGCVTDIRLGDGPTGWELARRARQLNPRMVVVYVTGDSAHQWAAEGVPKSVILEKPFADAQLVTAVSNLLNDQAAPL